MNAPRVMVIEEHSLVRRGVEAIAAEALPGATVTGCGNFPGCSPEADLIVCDFLVGGAKATGFLKALRMAGCRTPVLVFSLSANGGDEEESARAGADAFLPKGAGPAEFSVAMRTLLDGGGWAERAVFSTILLIDATHRLSKREQEVFAILGQEVPVAGHQRENGGNSSREYREQTRYP